MEFFVDSITTLPKINWSSPDSPIDLRLIHTTLGCLGWFSHPLSQLGKKSSYHLQKIGEIFGDHFYQEKSLLFYPLPQIF